MTDDAPHRRPSPAVGRAFANACKAIAERENSLDWHREAKRWASLAVRLQEEEQSIRSANGDKIARWKELSLTLVFCDWKARPAVVISRPWQAFSLHGPGGAWVRVDEHDVLVSGEAMLERHWRKHFAGWSMPPILDWGS